MKVERKNHKTIIVNPWKQIPKQLPLRSKHNTTHRGLDADNRPSFLFSDRRVLLPGCGAGDVEPDCCAGLPGFLHDSRGRGSIPRHPSIGGFTG